jgi:hypothetical protein
MRGLWDFNPRPKMFAKETRNYGIAMQSCSAFWNYSAALILSHNSHIGIDTLRIAE